MLTKQMMTVIALLCVCQAEAGVRSGPGGDQVVSRLQGMVRQVTQERDALKAENATLKAELDKLNKEKDALATDNEKMSHKLASQQASNSHLQARQEQTYEKLLEVVEKYKVLNRQKNELQLQLNGLQERFQQTSQQLGICDKHNGNLIEAAKELLERYQNKGTLTGLLQSEGLLQFESVEMETIVQDYEDRIRAEEYKETASLQN